MYKRQDLEGGKPIPITPEGITGGLISPDGQYILRVDDAAGVAVYPTAGGAARPIPNLERGFIPIRWSEDVSSVYGYLPDQIPTKVYQVNLVSGKKTLVQELQPGTTVGVVNIAPVLSLIHISGTRRDALSREFVAGGAAH